MDQAWKLLGGIGLGAGLMYFFDPRCGRGRRTRTRDRLGHLVREAERAADVTSRDVAHRLHGLWAELKAANNNEPPPDDHTLVERVRSRMGRVVSHPRAIQVSARDGRVTLVGPVLAGEVNHLIACVSRVRGVHDIENRLEVHNRPDHPALQGGVPRNGHRGELAQENWSPAMRLVAGGVGLGLLVNCCARRDTASMLTGTAGLGLFLRAASNKPFAKVVGMTDSPDAVEVHKTIHVDGPPERVFPFFARYDSFPRFMGHIREVRDLGNRRSHWVAMGPGGIPVSWEAAITRFVANKEIAWQSEPGSTVANAGRLRFDPEPDGRTRVTIDLRYTPPAGLLGHFAAKLFGADPRSELNEDLIRLKGLIEHGKTRAPGKGEVIRQELPIGT